MKKTFIAKTSGLSLILLFLLLVVTPEYIYADSVTSTSMQMSADDHSGVFRIDNQGNLYVKGKISQYVSPLSVSSSVKNWILKYNGIPNFLLQMGNISSGSTMGQFFLNGSIQSNSVSPTISGAGLKIMSGTNPLAVFYNDGNLAITGHAYEYVTNLTSFRPDAGSIQFQFSKYATENVQTTTVAINVIRTGTKNGTVTVQYHTLDGSALAGTNYQSVSGTLTFNDGQSLATISIPIIYDPSQVTSKSFFIEIFNPGNGCRLSLVSKVELTINPLPPNPQAVCTTLSGNEQQNLYELNRFIFDSSLYHPLIQSQATTSSILPDQAAVLRGTVLFCQY